jgi:hypothetical protein
MKTLGIRQRSSKGNRRIGGKKWELVASMPSKKVLEPHPLDQGIQKAHRAHWTIVCFGLVWFGLVLEHR